MHNGEIDHSLLEDAIVRVRSGAEEAWDLSKEVAQPRDIQGLLDELEPAWGIWSDMSFARHVDQTLWDHIVDRMPQDLLHWMARAPEHINRQRLIDRLLEWYLEARATYTRGPSDVAEHPHVLGARWSVGGVLVDIGAEAAGAIRKAGDSDLAAEVVRSWRSNPNPPGQDEARRGELPRVLLPLAIRALEVHTGTIVFIECVRALDEVGRVGEIDALIDEMVLAMEGEVLKGEYAWDYVSGWLDFSYIPEVDVRAGEGRACARIVRQLYLRDEEIWKHFVRVRRAAPFLKKLTAEEWKDIPKDFLVKGLSVGCEEVKRVLFARLGRGEQERRGPTV